MSKGITIVKNSGYNKKAFNEDPIKIQVSRGDTYENAKTAAKIGSSHDALRKRQLCD